MKHARPTRQERLERATINLGKEWFEWETMLAVSNQSFEGWTHALPRHWAGLISAASIDKGPIAALT